MYAEDSFIQSLGLTGFCESGPTLSGPFWICISTESHHTPIGNNKERDSHQLKIVIFFIIVIPHIIIQDSNNSSKLSNK